MSVGTLHVLFGENAVFHVIGEVFHPIFLAVAYVLAFIYGIVPNYAIAIALLTILIMAILTPLTVKSTKSMIAMQRMQPEIKKLQTKYKGAENREQLNKELMKLYKEQGINPAGGCVPMLLQMPFLIVLYDVIKGLTNVKTIVNPHHPKIILNTIAQPRYIPTSSRMYHDLTQHVGQMNAFGMNLALKPFSHHASTLVAVPFFIFVAIAVVLQYVQMKQMNSRNPGAAQANPQMQTMQKVMPIFFAYIYFLIPAAVVIYMIISTLIRIATQDIMFRTGMVTAVGAERSIPAKSKEVEGSPQKSIGAKSAPTTNGRKPSPESNTVGKTNPPVKGTTSRQNGAASASTNGNTDGANASKSHPRSKAKRTRRAR